MSQRPQALTALLVLTTLWGSTFVVIHSGVELLSPLILIGCRFLVGGLVLAALRPKRVRRALSISIETLPLSLSALAAFSLQTAGLMSTTPARSAFITSLSVVMVPALELLFRRNRPAKRLLAATVLAAGGVYVLFRPLGLEWRHGDTLTLISSALFAFYIVELGRLSSRHDEVSLVLSQCVTVAPVAFLAAPLLETPRISFAPTAILTILYLGAVCTALVFLLMAWAQARVSSVEAAIIYTLEPVVAAIISVGLGREPLTTKLLVGGLLVVIATGICSTGEETPRPPEGID